MLFTIKRLKRPENTPPAWFQVSYSRFATEYFFMRNKFLFFNGFVAQRFEMQSAPN